MNRFLKICGILALTMVGVAALGIGFMVHKGSALDGESRAYVKTALPAIATWDQRELLDRATPALRQAATPAQMTSLYDKLSRLGAIVSFEQPKGQALMMYNTAGNSETAAYTIKAKFQNGDALLKLALVKVDGRWMINGFHFEPLTRLTASRA